MSSSGFPYLSLVGQGAENALIRKDTNAMNTNTSSSNSQNNASNASASNNIAVKSAKISPKSNNTPKANSNNQPVKA